MVIESRRAGNPLGATRSMFSKIIVLRPEPELRLGRQSADRRASFYQSRWPKIQSQMVGKDGPMGRTLIFRQAGYVLGPPRWSVKLDVPVPSPLKRAVGLTERPPLDRFLAQQDDIVAHEEADAQLGHVGARRAAR